MLQLGIKIKSGKEILGQIPRLVFEGVKSFTGKIPVGNSGGANVPALKSFPIEKKLYQSSFKMPHINGFFCSFSWLKNNSLAMVMQ